MTSTPPPGRRANGLQAAEWGALVDLDPRLSEALLDRLAEAGVAAYAEPAGGHADPASRAVLLPKRPMDRLWVDAAHADEARSVVGAEVADLTALLAEENPSATAHGLIQAVPRAAAAKVLAPPDLPGRTTNVDTSDDEIFRQLVAGFDRNHGSAIAPWPVAEDVSDSNLDSCGDRSADDQARGRSLRRRSRPSADSTNPADPTAPALSELPEWLEPDALDDDGHFAPPPPPPVPRFQPQTIGCLLAIVCGLLLTFAPNVFGLYDSPALGLVGIIGFVGGAGRLVWAMHDSAGDDPDHGAKV